MSRSPLRSAGKDARQFEGSRTVNSVESPTHRVVPVRHYGRGVFAVVIGLLTLQIIFALATNRHISWPVVGQYLFNDAILQGLWTTIWISTLSMFIGLLIAVTVALMRTSGSRILQGVGWLYVFIFRGIPLLVLLLFIGNFGLFVDRIVIGIPFTDVVFVSALTRDVVTPLVASVVTLSLTSSAFSSEIVRAGLYAVDRGQHAAAKALGLNRMQTMRFIVMPQALRVIVPPLGNEFITTIKMSSLVSVIGAGDLLTITTKISSFNHEVLELLIVATFWYMVIVILWSAVQFFIERRSAAK